MTHADLSPTVYRPPRRVALLAAIVIASMSVIGLWRGVAEELRVGRQAAYLESFTRTHSAPPTPATAFALDAESLAPSGQQTAVAPVGDGPEVTKAAPAAAPAKAGPADEPAHAAPAEVKADPPVARREPASEPADEPAPSAVDRILEEERLNDQEPPPEDEPAFDPYFD